MTDSLLSFQQKIDELLANGDWHWERDKKNWTYIISYMYKINIIVNKNPPNSQTKLIENQLSKINDMPINSANGNVVTFSKVMNSPHKDPLLKVAFPSIAKNMLDKCFIAIKKLLACLDESIDYVPIDIEHNYNKFIQKNDAKTQITHFQELSSKFIYIISENIINIKNKDDSSIHFSNDTCWKEFINHYNLINKELKYICNTVKSKPIWLHIMLSDFDYISNTIIIFLRNNPIRLNVFLKPDHPNFKVECLSKKNEPFISALNIMSCWALDLKESTFNLSSNDFPLKMNIHNDYVNSLIGSLNQINELVSTFLDLKNNKKKTDHWKKIAEIFNATEILVAHRMTFSDVKKYKFILNHLSSLYCYFDAIKKIQLSEDISTNQLFDNFNDINMVDIDKILYLFKQIYQLYSNLINIEINNYAL